MVASPLSSLDQFIVGCDRILRGFTQQIRGTGRANPGNNAPSSNLNTTEQQHSAGLMRVNYTGEVAAQALYLGQALVARDTITRENLLTAAHEEENHLLWCEQRLNELDAHTSYLNPLWFMGSLSIGMMAGLVNDKYSLGFVVETERQVETHLTEHLSQLSVNDNVSRAILEQMCIDEKQHAHNALEQGATELPSPIKFAMRIPAKIMTTVAYYL